MTTPTSQAFGLDKKKSKVASSLMDVYDLRVGEPKISPFPYDILNKLQDQKNIYCYYPSHGDFALREMILKRYYPRFCLENIGITHGTMGALDFVMRANLQPGDEILIPDPGFPPYAKLAEFSRAKVRHYELNLDTGSKTFINWDHVEALITDRTKMILINSPHNPTGKILTDADLLYFERLIYKYSGISFVMDEVYRELIYSANPHFDFTRYIGRGYIVGSFSKMFPLQGARVGWVLTNAENMQKLAPYFNNATGAMSSFGQEIVKLLLAEDVSYDKFYAQALAQTRSILDKYKVDYVVPEGAFFIFIKYQNSGNEVVEELEELGVEVVPGAVFGKSGECFIRASFAQEPSILESAFTIIGKHWGQNNQKVIQ
jgi:aspartate/methionine/tyrosine aminotransferase